MVGDKLMFQMPWCQNHAEIIQGRRRRRVEPSQFFHISVTSQVFKYPELWLKKNGE